MWRWIKRIAVTSLALLVGVLALGLALAPDPGRSVEEIVAEVRAERLAAGEPMDRIDLKRASLPLEGRSREGRIIERAIACKARQDFEDLGQAAIENPSRFNLHKLSLLTSGKCLDLHPGQYVHITDVAMVAGLYAVKPTGHSQQYWTDRKWVRRLSE